MAGAGRSVNAVLITGASTGIGYATAKLLSESGLTVFAGVRTTEDAHHLSELSNVTPLLLDVRNADDSARAAQTIAASGAPLAGVVNNAGIAIAGPLEYLPVDELRRQFEVNVFGALAVTQAVLPLLRRSKGRIVFINCIAGKSRRRSSGRTLRRNSRSKR